MKILLIVFAVLSLNIKAQTLLLLTSGTETSLRGLSVVSDKIIWASGTRGSVSRSVDGGASWKWFTVKDFEKSDFRDIEAFDSSTAIIMAIAEPAYILKTVDGGLTWKTVYENSIKGMFLDAMDFRDKQKGIVTGDPVNNKFFIARTFDGGNTWKQISASDQPVADSGEACFAASGTNIKLNRNNEFLIVSGGLRSRLFINNKGLDMPVMQGTPSAGANSVAVKNKKIFIVTGGDFNAPESTFKNCSITVDQGKTWRQPIISPHGYRSCVEYITKKNWISCGLNGVDYSSDDGETWQWVSTESFNTCRKAKKGTSIFFAGPKGKIGKMLAPKKTGR